MLPFPPLSNAPEYAHLAPLPGPRQASDMAIQSQLQTALSLNVAGGTNSPSPTDAFLSTITLGSFFAPLGTINVPATGSTVAPFSALTVSNTSYVLIVANTGASGGPNVVLDMKSVGANSSQIAIAPGGRAIFWNVAQLPGATAANTSPSAWTLSSSTAVATTAAVAVQYA